jgi:FMN-dependent NADH-azoreductase
VTVALWNTAMASLRGLAEESLKAGHEQAAEHGRRVAQLISA